MDFDQVLELEPTIRGWATKWAGRRGLVDDLMQETFLRAWRGWDSFEPGTDLKGWLYVISRNVWVDWQRKPSNGKSIPAGLSADLEDHASLRTFDYQPDFNPVALLAEAAESVPADFLEVVLMLDVDRMSRQQVAAVLGIAEGTVSSRAHRARVILRERLEELAEKYGRL